MEKDIHGLERRFRRTIGALPCGYLHGEVFVDGKGEPSDYAVKEVNHSFLEITGMTREKVIGCRVAGLFSMNSVEEDIEVFSRVAITGDPVEKEFLSPFFGVYFRLFCFSPEQGSFVALLTDLTQEKKYRGRVEFLRDFANSTADEFFILDSRGVFVLGNRSVSIRLGVSQDEVPGHRIADLNPIADGKWWSTLWNSLLQKGSIQFETEHRSACGEVYPVELSVDLMLNGGRKYAAAVAKNISAKRTLGAALLKDRRYAEQAASTAGYLIWIIDPSGGFRPIMGGEGAFMQGPADSVFFPMIHLDERDAFVGRISSLNEGFFDFRMKTGRGMVCHRAVWSRLADGCTAGICYPLSGTGLSGQGSGSDVMDVYFRMNQAILGKLTRIRELMESMNHRAALGVMESTMAELSSAAGHCSLPERIRFDGFLQNTSGMLRQLLDDGMNLTVDTTEGSLGYMDPAVLENVLVRLLLTVQKTGSASGVTLRSMSSPMAAGIRVTVQGTDNIQNELERFFIPVRDQVPGIASVYAMVRSAGGRVVYEASDSSVDFSLLFPRASMTDEFATVLVALGDSVDAARSYAALRDAGFSAAIETDPDQIVRRVTKEGASVLVASSSLPEFDPVELAAGLKDLALIQIGGVPPDPPLRYLPEGFRTVELTEMVKELTSTAERPPAEDHQGDTPLVRHRPSPPLF